MIDPEKNATQASCSHPVSKLSAAFDDGHLRCGLCTKIVPPPYGWVHANGKWGPAIPAALAASALADRS